MKFSVLTPVYDPPVDALRAAIESVIAQTYADWELVLVDDCSTQPAVRSVLAEMAARDSRITVVTRETNGGICAASQDALDRAQGEFIALLDHDDELTADALHRVAAELDAQPDTDYLYTDEDKIDADGVTFDPFHKPVWSPERLRSQMYTGHLSVIRTDLAREVGGFRLGFEGSQDHDLVLRVTERARRIVHLAKILYHWRVVPGSAAGDPNAKSYTWEAGRRAVQEHLERVGIAGSAQLGALPGTYRVEREFPKDKLVSIIIPTRGSAGLVWGQQRCFVVEAVRSALEHTNHPNVEVVVVADTETPTSVLDELESIAGNSLVVVPYDEPFNFSRKCNVGYLAARGDIVLFLNDDVEVVSDGWLETLCAPLADQDVGMVGAKLLYGDGTLQHAGHLYDRHEYSHAFLGALADATVGFSALHIDREVSGVTAACAALRRDTYDRIGGFCEDLPGNFNDVDFSFKVSAAGLRILWNAHVVLYHFESRTREPKVHKWEYDRVVSRWGTYAVDPYLPLQNKAPILTLRMKIRRDAHLVRQYVAEGGVKLVLHRAKGRLTRVSRPRV